MKFMELVDDLDINGRDRLGTIDAVASLIEKGFVVVVDGVVILTDAGWKACRELGIAA